MSVRDDGCGVCKDGMYDVRWYDDDRLGMTMIVRMTMMVTMMVSGHMRCRCCDGVWTMYDDVCDGLCLMVGVANDGRWLWCHVATMTVDG